MDSDSDLTDADDLDIPLSQLSKSADKSDGSLRIRGALKAPRATSFTTQWLFDAMIDDDIDLNADYQRDVVWPDLKQTGLIDSIFRNYYIPPLIFALKCHEDGSEKRVCIDGKQRLTSIFRFLRGDIPYKDAYTNEKYVYKAGGTYSHKAKVLPEKYKKIFRQKQVVCMEYQDLKDDSEREIFQRVQLGMALTPAEKLQAVSSFTATFIKELQAQYVTDGFAVHLDWDTSRGTDFRCLATAVYNIVNWPALKTLVSYTRLQKWLQDTDILPAPFCDEVHAVFQTFLALAKDSKFDDVFGLAKVAPVEFMATTLLIYVHRNKLTMAQLAEAIKAMREDVRRQEQDIRMNTRCVKIIIAFIKGLKLSKLKADSGPPAAVKIGTVKRKRTVQTDVEEDRKPPPPPKASSPATSSTLTSAPRTTPPSTSTPKSKSTPPRKTASTTPPLPKSELKQPSVPPPSVATNTSTPAQPQHASQPSPFTTRQPSHSSFASYPSVPSRPPGAPPETIPDRLAAIRLARSASNLPPHPSPSGPPSLPRPHASARPGSAFGPRLSQGPAASPLPPPPSLLSRLQPSEPPAPGPPRSALSNGRGGPMQTLHSPPAYAHAAPPAFRPTDFARMGTPVPPAQPFGAPQGAGLDPRRGYYANGQPRPG